MRTILRKWNGIVQDIVSKTTTTTKHEQKNQNPKCKRVFIVYYINFCVRGSKNHRKDKPETSKTIYL